MRELVYGGGSTGFTAMGRIIVEGSGKHHYTATIRLTIVEHWFNQSEVAPYPIVRPSGF